MKTIIKVQNTSIPVYHETTLNKQINKKQDNAIIYQEITSTLSFHLNNNSIFFSCGFQAGFTLANITKKKILNILSQHFCTQIHVGFFFFFPERWDQAEQRQLSEAQIPCLLEWVLVIKSLAHLILPVSQAKSQSLHLIAYICVHVSNTKLQREAVLRRQEGYTQTDI